MIERTNYWQFYTQTILNVQQMVRTYGNIELMHAKRMCNIYGALQKGTPTHVPLYQDHESDITLLQISVNPHVC